MEKFVDKLIEKSELAKSESDFTYFFNLLVYGEALTKIIVLSVAACLNQDKNRHQYRVLHGLVRASGIGEWSKELDDMLSGTASQHIDSSFREYQVDLTKKCAEGEWQYLAVERLADAMTCLGIESQVPQGKVDLKFWFRLFAELRNKTRGHGATPSSKAASASILLRESLDLLHNNLSLLNIPCAYVKRNLSGKYRVSAINNCYDSFDDLKTSNIISLEEGIYLSLGGYRKIELMLSDTDLQDFYISNGGFSNKKYELLSYFSDDKLSGNSADYMYPPGKLPPSESEGLTELRTAANCFTNVPGLNYEYINRLDLEDELFSLLMDDRRDLVTLLGRGGIGKTSLALTVIPRLFYEKKYEAIIWFSSRDIDLQDSGAKLVSADVITSEDIAKYFCHLVLSEEQLKSKEIDPVIYFQEQLTKSEIGPCLFVFDNFETTDNPIELYKWVDTYVRRPNKILITTRLRDFKGDYPLNVHGMTEEEATKLIDITSEKLGILNALTPSIREDIYRVSSGHPYIIKILLGELSVNSVNKSIKKVLAGSDEILVALFERTYAALSPCSQRVFLTLSSWNSSIPKKVLEVVLMTSFDDPQEVGRSIDLLIQYSMAEEVNSEKDGYCFIGLPYIATVFGKKKLSVSPLEPVVLSDSHLIQKFGPSKLDDKNLSLDSHVSRFIASLRVEQEDFSRYQDIIEQICFTSNINRLDFARWLLEDGSKTSLNKSVEVLTLYLENESNKTSALSGWRMLADVQRLLGHHHEEIHSLIQLAKATEIDFSELSNVANKVNQKFGKRLLVIDSHSVKSQLIKDLYSAMRERECEADATDLSRMAWLALNLGEREDALQLVKSGLSVDEDNQHCLSLRKQFSRDTA